LRKLQKSFLLSIGQLKTIFFDCSDRVFKQFIQESVVRNRISNDSQ